MTIKRTKLCGAMGGLIAAATLAGCMVGPDFTRPDPPKDKSYLTDPSIEETVATNNVLGGEAQRFVRDLDIPGQWWLVFESRPLDDLIARALQANPDIQAAIAALKVAQQNARAQRAALFPTIGVLGSGSNNQISNALSPATAQPTSIFGLFTALLSVSYTPDVFGGIRRQTESAEAQAEAQCFLLEAAYLTLASNVVVAAITEASLRGQLDATKRSVDVQRQTLTLLQRRQTFGQSSLAEVVTQRAALAQTEATLPPLEKQLSQQRNLLANLLGETTAHIPSATFELADLRLPQQVPVSLPSRMVEQRPDVRAAEANVHSASAAVGVAVAAQLPQITLGLNIGAQSISLDTLFSVDNGASAFAGVNVVQTLLDGGALLARKRAAEAAWEQSKAQYRSTVLNAFRNVADTLRALQFDAEAVKATADAEQAAALSLEIARRRLAAGDAGILEILNAELTHQQTLIALTQARASRYADTAALYQALGGGWWNRDAGSDTYPAKRAVCRAPTNPPKPQPWPEATRPRPLPDTARPQPLPDATKPASKPSKGFWGSRF